MKYLLFAHTLFMAMAGFAVDAQHDRDAAVLIAVNEHLPPDIARLATSYQQNPLKNQVAAGAYHTCIIVAGGKVVCFGDGSDGKTAVPKQALKDVARVVAGFANTCAITMGGQLYCWGKEVSHIPDAFTRDIAQVVIDDSVVCALKKNGTLGCFGKILPFRNNIFQDIAHVALTQGPEICMVTTKGKPLCLDRHGLPQTSWSGFAGDIAQIWASWQNICLVAIGGRAGCFGPVAKDMPKEPLDDVQQLSLGTHHACVVTKDWRLVCFGSNLYGGTNVPEDLADGIAEVSVGTFHTCARKRNGKFRCWGAEKKDVFGRTLVPEKALSIERCDS